MTDMDYRVLRKGAEVVGLGVQTYLVICLEESLGVWEVARLVSAAWVGVMV